MIDVVTPLMCCNTLILVEEECLEWLSKCRLSALLTYCNIWLLSFQSSCIKCS